MTTKLASAMAQAPSSVSSPKVSRFMAALAGKRVLEPISIPRLGITALMTIVGTNRRIDLEAEVVRKMHARGITVENVFNEGMWELCRAEHVLADALLDDDEKLRANPPPLGTVEEIGGLHRDEIADMWRQYSDLETKHDPASQPLTDEEHAFVREALVKKNVPALLSCGVRRLSLYLLTLAAPPAISPIPTSSSGDSSPES